MRLLPCSFVTLLVCVFAREARAQPPAGAWFVPPPPRAGAVDLGARVPASSIGGVEQLTVIGRRRPVAGPLEVPDLKGEDLSRYHREPDYLTRSHRAPCGSSFASVGDHEGRGSSLATGLGAAGCD